MRHDAIVDAASAPSAAAARPWWPMPRRDPRGRERVRRPGDGVLLFFAAIAFFILTVRATDITVAGTNLTVLLSTLPEGLHGLFTFLFQLGSLWMVAAVAAAALLWRNVLLAATVTASGLVAAAVAHLLFHWLDTESATILPAELVAVGTTPSFPLVRMAIAAALATTITPYVIRPIRILAWLLAGAVGIAAIYLAEGLPVDV